MIFDFEDAIKINKLHYVVGVTCHDHAAKMVVPSAQLKKQLHLRATVLRVDI